MNKFVMTRLKGGLGNQMFQYAAGKNIALKFNVPLLIDATFLEKNPDTKNYTKRNLELDVWKTEYVIADIGLVKSIRKLIDDRTGRLLSKLGVIKSDVQILNEQTLPVYKKTQNSKRPIYIDGYWQDENYFSEIRNVLLKDFTPSASISDSNNSVLKNIKSTTSASLHVRRGDYITLKDAAAFHGVCSVEYYQNAIQTLYYQKGIDHFFVFSDEIEWTKNSLNFPCDVSFVDHNIGVESYWDIHLMSQCKHHIIANSSFSWWGAWLNPSNLKTVIAPNNWFAAGGGENIVPKDWIKI